MGKVLQFIILTMKLTQPYYQRKSTRHRSLVTVQSQAPPSLIEFYFGHQQFDNSAMALAILLSLKI